MKEQKIERVLKLLGECIPRAPEKTVEKMVKTVNAIEKERAKSAENSREPKPEKNVDKSIGNQGIGGPKL